MGVFAMIRRFTAATAAVIMMSVVSRPVKAQTDLDHELAAALQAAGFTGTIQQTLERRLGRTMDKKLANLGRLLWV
jgi:cytochrome c peroxidase